MSIKIEAVRGKSPYAKHHKAPYTYGPAYQRWAAALGSAGAGFNTADYLAADAAFRLVFNIPKASSDYGKVYDDGE